MAWKVIVDSLAQKAGRAMLSAAWNEGLADEFRFSREINVTADSKDKAVFISAAKAAKERYKAREAEAVAAASSIEVGLAKGS